MKDLAGLFMNDTFGVARLTTVAFKELETFKKSSGDVSYFCHLVVLQFVNQRLSCLISSDCSILSMRLRRYRLLSAPKKAAEEVGSSSGKKKPKTKQSEPRTGRFPVIKRNGTTQGGKAGPWQLRSPGSTHLATANCSPRQSGQPFSSETSVLLALETLPRSRSHPRDWDWD